MSALWTAIAAVVVALSGVAASVYRIVRDRTKLRILEQLNGIAEGLSPESAALQSIRETQDILAERLAESYKLKPVSASWVSWVGNLWIASGVGVLVILAIQISVDPKGRKYLPEVGENILWAVVAVLLLSSVAVLVIGIIGSVRKLRALPSKSAQPSQPDLVNDTSGS